ncbi:MULTISPECIES: TIGR01212 family radical SAM protein [Flavobacteriaceae]|uniref:TIGR01212 family radical SAM protein n=2 Tax=Flavobacteriaceae TaxID=49546 RepID=A0A4Y8AS26_9FLAO|nr:MULTISPECIES: TIGR01212 family radical SAM protein [Flavobacteriaceae]TEW74000.1 TIGR01212 family radical SAM protein [Gramella jeungdoensis]GGK39502.1 TIGR01212 family radical SAM protein [Lutibacter litoralis]
MQFTGKRYLDYSSFIKLKFGERVQKISLDIGFSCPNRDGSKGVGGCTYCNNNTFNPDYCEPQKSVKTQLEQGIEFFSRKGKNNKFLAYFQAYTNTYSDFESLKQLYLEALRVPKVVGLAIGTRPDCISEEIIDFLDTLSKTYFISLEFGVESTNEKTLLQVNRCHTFEETKATFNLCRNKGFHLGAHIILGLPGESESDLINHAIEISKLPINTLKLHHLQIVRNSIMAVQYKRIPENFNLFTSDNYINFISKFITHLRPDIIIERFISEAPKELLIAPKWGGLKNFEIVAKIDKNLQHKNLWQGKNY